MNKPASEYFDVALNVVVKVYEAPKSKRTLWIKNGSFYASKMRIENGSCMFANFSRKPGKA